MNSINNILQSIRKDIYTDKKTNACCNFFYLSMLHYAISLEIASTSYSQELVSFEKLCAKIPKKLGCRSSIKTVLDKGVHYGFFVKLAKEQDKRIKKYKLSEEFSLMITEWYLDKKVKFIN